MADFVRALLLATKHGLQDRDVAQPARVLSEEEIEKMGLRFYNSQVHSAAFVLPQFIKKVILSQTKKTADFIGNSIRRDSEDRRPS